LETLKVYFFTVLPQSWELSPYGMRLTLIALLAGMTGSFINMAMWRIPRGESIFLPRSHCPVCKHVLSVGDLLPVLSYLALGGKCRYCKTRFGVRYMLIELFLIVVAVALYYHFGLGATSLGAFGLVSLGVFTTGVLKRRVWDREIMKKQTGFTYIEVMMCLVIVAAVIIPFGNTFLSTYGRSLKNKEYVIAYNLLEEKMEELKLVPFYKLKSDYSIYAKPPRREDSIFSDEVIELFPKMRENEEIFYENFSDIFTEKNVYKDRVHKKFLRNYLEYYNREYELYPEGYHVFKRYTKVEDVSAKPDKKYEPDLIANKETRKDLLKVTVTVWIDSRTTSRKLQVSMYRRK